MFRPSRLALWFAACLALALTVAPAHAQLQAQSEPIQFEVEGLTLSGLLTTPDDKEASALVILVHGYGRTNVVEDRWYYALRTRLAAAGIASFMWDKPGCGTSEGTFDADQSVQSSAREVVAAASFLREISAPGAQSIGLWGVSRAGWIAPLAMQQDRALAFWISVSGVDAKETFGYLLRSNWALEGRSEAQVDALYAQWMTGNQIVTDGGSYQDYLAATAALREDAFYKYISPQSAAINEQEYNALVAKTRALAQPVDPQTGLAIYVEGFDAVLSGLDVPVLALFGARDSVVDWRSTRALYARTIGQNPKASLDIVRFENGNHNLQQSETGSFREMLEILNRPRMVNGYFDTIMDWLRAKGFAQSNTSKGKAETDRINRS